MNQQLRVVMLLRQFYPRTGGYQNQALRLARELQKRDIVVSVLTQQHGTLAPYEVHQQIPIHRVPTFRAGHLASVSYLFTSFLWMVRNRRQFQIIHANRSSSGLIAGLIGCLLRKKVLYKLTRGDEVEAKGFRTTWLGSLKVHCLKRTVDKFVAITEEIKEALQQIGIPAEKVVKISNGMPLEDLSQAYDKEQVKLQVGWAAETTVITFVGRLVPAKGVDWLLEVWQHVVRKHERARLLIVGDGSERGALEAQAQALGISNTLAFVGRQPDVFKFLAASDIFVLPSRQEGTSNALLEAMSQSLPVIVADDVLGGNRGVVNHQQDGYVIKLGESKTFVDTLCKLLEDVELRTEMGKRARRKIEKNFSMTSVADRYCALYHELLGNTAK
ncbi:MAG: glycosyltransferase family 4 protein [Deltaproteobacteria bacterium]|nr:glycosyltransferase family 4 protein [Deltaproteobacteria bacterium]